MLLSILHGEHSKEETKAHTEERIAAFESRQDARFDQLEEWLAEILASRPLGTKWAAKDSILAVRIAPDHSARKVSVLLPYQVVSEIDHEAKWIQVEFHDHRTGVSRIGWVQKKHLERVTPLRRPTK